MDASTTEETDSPSSLVAEAPISDSQDQLLPNENVEIDKKAEEERKLRRLERRKALALARSPQAPKLSGRGVLQGNNTIDLTNEDDDPSNRWFKKTFNADRIPKKVKSPEDAKLFAVPRTISKNAPKSLLTRENLQKKLQASMSAKRRKAQEERRKMYEEDNEHLKGESEEEEEEEEEIVFKKKKTKTPKNEEYDSDEDDEDYKPPGNGNGSDDDENGEGEKMDDDMSVNLLNDSFTYDVFNNAKRSGPGSMVSNFDTHSQEDLTEKPPHIPTMSQIMGQGAAHSESNSDDLLNFCSGKFESEGFPDTLQMLLDEGKNEKKLYVPSVPPKPADSESDDDDSGPMKKSKSTKKSSRILDSDEEDSEDVVEETTEILKSQDPFASSSGDLEEVETEMTTTSEVHLTRIVVSGDEDSDDDVEADDEKDEEGEDEEEEGEEEDDVAVPQEEEEPEAEPNFDDEDDELAVLKRIEHQEYKKQMKKTTLFDDEASLSGDDVGSDLDDEEGVENAYEAEEGDADDVPDNDTIRRQNFKMLMKQENDQETRALAKLQDRLLADGDLGGVETNRQFRFKLREDVEIQMAGLDGDDQQTTQEDDDDGEEENEEKKKERADMIKYRIEHAEELLLLEHTRDDDDDEMFKRAGKLMKKTEKLVIESTEETTITIKKPLQKPSLLSKTALAVSFQEVLNGGGATTKKQMYVQNYEKTSGNSGSATSSKPIGGAMKRGLKSPEQVQNEAPKRVRSSKLASLE